jgi:uncharacterized protein
MVAGEGLSIGRILAWLGIASVVLAVNLPAARAQSFNCRSATFPDEWAICRDTELSRLDERVAGLYHVARNQAQGGAWQMLDKGQTEWILARRACGPDRSCIQEAYQRRIRDLGQYVQGAPASPTKPQNDGHRVRRFWITVDAAEKQGKSERTVRREAARGEAIPDVAKLAGTSTPRRSSMPWRSCRPRSGTRLPIGRRGARRSAPRKQSRKSGAVSPRPVWQSARWSPRLAIWLAQFGRADFGTGADMVPT